MGLQFGKRILLGKGLHLDGDKKEITFVHEGANFRITLHPKKIKINAEISGIDLNQQQKPKLQVIERPTAIDFLKSGLSMELKNPYDGPQRILGIVGILCIFLSFKYPLLFFIGALSILLMGLWRKKTDPQAYQVKKALRLYRQKKYLDCIGVLETALEAPDADPILLLVIADCYLNLDNPAKAYEVYFHYFQSIDVKTLANTIFWSPVINTILMAIDQRDYDFAMKLCDDLEGFKGQVTDQSLWRGYLKGLAFMGKSQYAAAIEVFKDALGRKRTMEAPYIDIHYQLGICYGLLGKNSLAKQRFTRVYRSDTSYKKIKAIMEAIDSNKDYTSFL